MPEVVPSQEYEQQVQQPNTSHFEGTKNEIRAGFEDFIRVNFDETGLLSASEVASQRQYVNSILNDPNATQQKLQQLANDYLGSFAQRTKSENVRLYSHDVIGPLKSAVSAGIISAASYREWIDWVRDPSRTASEKKASIAGTLPDYLEKRYQLSRKRERLVGDTRFKALADSSDPRLKALAAKVSDDGHFLNALSFSEREKAIIDATAELPVGAEEQKIFNDFMTDLNSAVSQELISEKSKKKWIARFKDPSVNSRAKVYFVSSQFPAYVSAWQKVKDERGAILKDPVVKDLTDKDLKDIKNFTEKGKFLDLHHDRKISLLAEVRSALTAHKEGKRVLHDETKSVLGTAAAAGYISSNKVGPWLEHVMNGTRSIHELKTFVKDWAKVRYRFDQVQMTMTEGKVPQGLQRLSVESFLSLNYAQRLSYVNEAESRLHIEKTQPKDTAFQDKKGKVRHALDTENWDEADVFLAQAWPLAETESDRHELQSMEKYLNAFRGKEQAPTTDENAEQEIANANKEISAVLALMPGALRPFYESALKRGAGCVHCVSTLVYNVKWCQDRGFIPHDASEGKDDARQETEWRLQASGPGHGDGLENNCVDGFDSPAIRTEGWGPNNIYASPGEAETVAQVSNANKENFSYWYWSNLRVDNVSKSEYSYVSTALNYRIKRAARTLEKHGKFYSAA